MKVSIQQACMNALQAWLQTALGSDVVVAQRWPSPQKPLPSKAATLLMVGMREEEFLSPTVVDQFDLPGPQGSQGAQGPQGPQYNVLYRWKVAEITQPFQIDLWATYDVTRDDMIARLQDQMYVGTLAGDAAGNSPTLTLGDGWDGVVDFIIDQGAINDLPNAAEVSEWRATYSGDARAVLYIDAVSAKQAQINVRQTINGHLRPDDVAI